MMFFLYVRQTVVDYARWKEGFDPHLSARQAGGATNKALMLRNVDDPHGIIVVLGWCDLKQARLFSQSVSLQAALKKMGGWIAGSLFLGEWWSKLVLFSLHNSKKES